MVQMSSSKRSKLPEPVKSSSKRSSSKDKPTEKGKDKKESKESRSKSRDSKKERERSASKDRSREKSRDDKSREKDKDKVKEKERKKSLIPSTSKDRSKDKDKESSKSKSKREAPPRDPTPPPEPDPPEDEYADDFEDYDDDFEEDADVEEDDVREDPESKPSPPVPQQQQAAEEEEANSETEESARSPPDSAKENRENPRVEERRVEERSSPPRKEQSPPKEGPREEYGEVEEEAVVVKKEEEDQTPMMRRLQSRQGGRRVEAVKQQVAQNVRVLSATERKISFSNTTTVSSIAVSESNDRYRMLRNLIGGLERKSTVLFAHPPVKDYDFYIEMFGNSGKAQTFTQTGEDNVTEESQTEQEEMVTKWTQQPAQDDVGWGAEGLSSVKYGHDDDDLLLFRGPSAAQSEALHKFMDVASGVMFDLLASTRHNGEYFSMESKSKFSFSAGYNNFQLVPTANESKITAIARSKTDEYSLLCAFHVLQSNLPTIIKRSLLVEYPLDRNAPPQRLFLAQSVVNSTSYSEDGTMLFAGLQDGSIVAWDLYESAAAFDHRCPWLDSKAGIALREPSFDTSFMSSIIHDDRTLEIVAVHVVSSGGGSVFQLCALDECGTISTWTVERQAKPPGAQGCRPGSRLLLTLSSIVRPDSSILRQSPSGYIMANCLAALPEDQMQLLIGTDVGFIASMSRGKGGVQNCPRLYKSPMHVYGEVLCMRFSPFEPKILATGLSTGSVSIHKAGQVGALVILTPPNSSRTPVSLIEWSPICTTVFYTMHESGHVLSWNLSIGKTPQAINDLNTERMGRAVCSLAWHEKASARESSGIGYLALGLSNGQVHVHALEPVKAATNQSLTGILRRMEAGL